MYVRMQHLHYQFCKTYNSVSPHSTALHPWEWNLSRRSCSLTLVQCVSPMGKKPPNQPMSNQISSICHCSHPASKNYSETNNSAVRKSNCQWTCMPQIRKPRLLEVVVRHLFIWLCLFSSDASSPCCLVPIFRSKIHGSSIFHVRFSSSINSAWNW